MSSTIIKPHQLGIKPQQLGIKSQRLGVKPQQLGVKPQQLSYKAQTNNEAFPQQGAADGEDFGTTQTMSKQSLKHIIHDLNHHLMLIGLSADNLAESSNRNQRASENARILRRNLDQVSAILAGLFADNKANNDEAAIGWAQLDLLLQKQKYDWHLILGDKIKLTIFVEPFAGRLHLEPMALMRILTNFVHNAVDAIREKKGYEADFETASITITIQAEDIAHSNLSSKDTQNLSISIKDNGAGVAESLKHKLFEPGETSKTANNLKRRGYGLSAVKEQVLRWQGKVELKSSSADAGSHFVLSLPLYNENP